MSALSQSRYSTSYGDNLDRDLGDLRVLIRASLRLIQFILWATFFIFLASCLHFLNLILPLKKRVLPQGLFCWVLKRICNSCGIVVQRGGELTRALPQRSLIVSNHVSYIDIVVLGSCFPTAFMAKNDVRTWPIMGVAAQLSGGIFVDRDCPQSRLRSIYSLKDRLQSHSVVVFPEGTTSPKREPDLSNWRNGQMFAGYRSAEEIWTAGLNYQDQNEIAWIDDMEFVPHFWKILKRDQTQVKVCAHRILQKNDVRVRKLSWASAYMSREICKGLY